MPKLPRWTALEAERALLAAGFQHLRSKGSHRIYGRGEERMIVPFHGGVILHPKTIRQVVDAISGDSAPPN